MVERQRINVIGWKSKEWWNGRVFMSYQSTSSYPYRWWGRLSGLLVLSRRVRLSGCYQRLPIATRFCTQPHFEKNCFLRGPEVRVGWTAVCSPNPFVSTPWGVNFTGVNSTGVNLPRGEFTRGEFSWGWVVGANCSGMNCWGWIFQERFQSGFWVCK